MCLLHSAQLDTGRYDTTGRPSNFDMYTIDIPLKWYTNTVMNWISHLKCVAFLNGMDPLFKNNFH